MVPASNYQHRQHSPDLRSAGKSYQTRAPTRIRRVVACNDMISYERTTQNYAPGKTGATVAQTTCDLSDRTRLPTKVAESDRGRGHQQNTLSLMGHQEVTVRAYQF